MKETKIINFFGGPGVGKSTHSASLFSKMKQKHMDVELSFEYAKNVVWEDNKDTLKDQFFISANQHRNISRLYGKVEYIISDSPILLSLIYKNKYSNENQYPKYDENFDKFITNLFNSYNNINIFLKRDLNTFKQNGRVQNINESILIDDEIETLLSNNNIKYFKLEPNKETSNHVIEIIKNESYL